MQDQQSYLRNLIFGSNFQNNQCCGIVGYIGNQAKAGEVCIQGLQILESRGYDSCGIVSIDQEGNFVRTKFASSDRFGGDCIKRMELEGKGKHDHCIGIGHTRWATHGDKTDVNAHPHYDQKERIALIHNGLIENYHHLKEELRDKYGIRPVSQTDTEIVALYIGIFLDQGHELFEAITKCVEILEGAYSFVLISILDPTSMYIVKNTGTMVIGVAKELHAVEDEEVKTLDIDSNEKKHEGRDEHLFQIVASDTTVFQDYTKHYYNIDDKEIIKISIQQQVERHKLREIKEELIKIKKPPGIDHFYVMEMLDQPNAVCKALNYGARFISGEPMVKLGGLEQHEEKLASVQNLIIAACGTSFYAGQYAEYLMRELNIFQYVEAKIASEITDIDLNIKNGGFLSVSQSGETMDLLIPFRRAKEFDLARLNVVNKVMSTLAREESCGVFLNCGRELSVASTKAFISQATVLTLVSLWFAQRKNFKATKKIRAGIISELRFLSSNVQKVLDDCVSFSKSIAREIKAFKHLFLLGTGLGEIVAKEGALKIKELTYNHCQCLNINNISNHFYNYLKKNENTPVVFVVLSDKYADEMIDAMLKLAERARMTPIVICDIQDKQRRDILENFCQKRIFYVPNSGYMSALLCVMPLQRLAYDLTIELGFDPDRPRNLAKELTTK
ncbi:glucosamine-fructose-6-phosphate aminotransferase [Stylonychia lemnae]|uniref:glutamine--fructose-6-phosphate transaminase (isomerizing) n=1 Tax=Stylonychia lemnae TaxID=5949 RepID=A0A078B3A1_STYLE|nr:glucosamine-fructose-6-phosphate aminotransferase [Stylonychia lemnae]|eukprot:CDW89005.1 glucosamine-fructose-6-phosphate aminotransferase [Stylonychia lemnae]